VPDSALNGHSVPHKPPVSVHSAVVNAFQSRSAINWNLSTLGSGKPQAYWKIKMQGFKAVMSVLATIQIFSDVTRRLLNNYRPFGVTYTEMSLLFMSWQNLDIPEDLNLHLIFRKTWGYLSIATHNSSWHFLRLRQILNIILKSQSGPRSKRTSRLKKAVISCCTGRYSLIVLRSIQNT